MTQLHGDLHDPATGQLGAWQGRQASPADTPGRVFTACYAIGAAAVVLLGSLTVWAHHAGMDHLAAAAVVLLSATAAGMLWLCTPGGERFVNIIADRMRPESEGSARSTPQATWLPDDVPSAVWLMLVFCILVQIGLGVIGLLPAHLMQPISVLWAAPLLYYASARFLKSPHPLRALWPGLYALHAVLVLLGVPLTVGAPLQALDVLVPGAVYGIIVWAAALLHRRLARQHMRAIARSSQAHRCVRGRKHAVN